MSKVRLTGSNSGYVEIAAVADAGNLSFTMPTHGTALIGNGNNEYTGITTFSNDVKFDGATAGYDVVWDRSDNQLEFADHAKISMGSDGDMQLYHDGNHSYIDDAGQGNLRLRSGTLEIQNFAGNKTSAVFSSGSGQTLNFNNNTKFVTTNTGVVVSGICTATSFSGSGANLTNLPNDTSVINDISILALKVSALENSAASNTNSTYVDTFQDSSGVASFTTSGRDASGEFVSSVYNATTNISAGWKGGGNQNTGTDASNATSYTGYDGVSRSKGQIVGNSNFSGYNTFNLGHIFGASDNFEVIFNQRGSWHALYRLHGNLGSNMSAIGTYRSEPGYSLASAFSSHMGGLTMAGAYPAPTGSNFDGTTFYRFYRESNSIKITYYNSVSDVSLDSTILNDLRTSTSYVPNTNGFGKPTTINQQMLLGMGEGGSTSHMKIEMANTFAEATSATGSATSVTINAPSTVSKMGVVVTYIDHSGTATLNTDLKVYLSANNGSNFTQVTLAALPLFATGVKMAKANDVTISNTGTQLKWKIEFANQASGSKETRVTGISLQY